MVIIRVEHSVLGQLDELQYMAVRGMEGKLAVEAAQEKKPQLGHRLER